MVRFQIGQVSVSTSSSSSNNTGQSYDGEFSTHGPSTEIENGPHVGQYTILKTLQKGKFGTVKLAKHITTGEKVAIKEIDKNKASKSDLLREVKSLKCLDHPNILKLLQVVEKKDFLGNHFLYIITEYAEGGDLFDYVGPGLMQEDVVRNKFRQIVSAVHYCHQNKIIHRDLKLENILLDSKNNIKIADFGFSREFHTGNELNTYCGTVGYVAPEILQGQTYEGPGIDVWALGVILYELITDSPPFGELSAKTIKKRVLRGEYHIPSYVSTECKNLINKILVLNPRHRASIEEIMKDEWFNLGLQEEIEVLAEIGYDQEEIKKCLQGSMLNDDYEN